MSSLCKNLDTKAALSCVKHERTSVIEIPYFSTWLESNTTISDTVLDLQRASLCLAVYQQGYEYNPRVQQTTATNLLITITLRCVAKFQSSISQDFEYEISFINSNGEATNVRAGRQRLNNGIQESFFNYRYIKGRIPSCFQNDRENLIPNDRLQIRCKIARFEKVQLYKQVGTNEMDLKICGSRLSNDFKSLLQSGEASDVTFTCEGEEFKAHSVILSARSPVFAVMFRHEMKEKKDRRIEIVDMEKGVLMELLTYMYTDTTNKLDEMARGLLAAADKYDLERLRNMCERSLSAKLCVEDAAEILMLADTHSANQLKKLAINYILLHRSDIIKTAGWKDMLSKRMDLLSEIFNSISQ